MGKARIFFSDGFSQISESIHDATDTKVLPYKYTFRIPENPIPALRKKVETLFKEKSFNEMESKP